MKTVMLAAMVALVAAGCATQEYYDRYTDEKGNHVYVSPIGMAYLHDPFIPSCSAVSLHRDEKKECVIR